MAWGHSSFVKHALIELHSSPSLPYVYSAMKINGFDAGLQAYFSSQGPEVYGNEDNIFQHSVHRNYCNTWLKNIYKTRPEALWAWGPLMYSWETHRGQGLLTGPVSLACPMLSVRKREHLPGHAPKTHSLR